MTNLIRRRLCARHGHTLAEVLVVILIIGVLSAIAAPKVSGMFQVQQPKRVLDRLTQDLTLARMRAIRSGRPATVQSTSDRRYIVWVQNNTGGGDTNRKIDVNADFKEARISTFAVTFDSRGIAKTGSSSVVTATRESFTDSLKISPVGRLYRAY